MRGAFDAIAKARDAEDEWCSVEKAESLGALCMALRPACVVEIGVWRGASALPILIALQRNPPAARTGLQGMLIAIDPWSKEASAAGEAAENASWWKDVDHARAFYDFTRRMEAAGVRHLCQVIQAPSDRVTPPDAIDLLHVDGNHSDQAVRDVERFASHVVPGGILVMDDLSWSGGHVERAYDRARSLGFRELYRIGQCAILQRMGVVIPPPERG